MRRQWLAMLICVACGTTDEGSDDGSEDTGSVGDGSADESGSPTTASEADESGDAGAGCADNNDCAATEICWEAQCDDAWNHRYELRVLSFGQCMVDGWGDAEIFYRVYLGEETASVESPVDTCPAAWPATITTIEDFETPFVIEFYELDAFVDDLLGEFCWADPGPDCGPVPKTALHEGSFEQTWPVGQTAEFEFTAVE